jgi:hypothetical protein
MTLDLKPLGCILTLYPEKISENLGQVKVPEM